MRPLGLPWMGGNFLRLIAIIFLVYDLSAKLDAQPPSDTTSNDGTGSRSTTVSAQDEQLLTASGIVQWPFTTSSTTIKSSLLVATETVITRSNGLTPQMRAIMDDNNQTKESSSQEQTEADYGLSGIPRQRGAQGEFRPIPPPFG
ncbi:uncharacterized protein IAS62_000963 [Cryptococcus decagattii]|uniref:Uncharacterized protein n=1 Tax=Cryptococcus decagattii TaxID=1859122 RepID=A0ABZ2AMA0_9TREE